MPCKCWLVSVSLCCVIVKVAAPATALCGAALATGFCSKVIGIL